LNLECMKSGKMIDIKIKKKWPDLLQFVNRQ
jgi:hypothetical protein